MHANRILPPIISIILITTLLAGLISVSATTQTSATPATTNSIIASDNVQAGQTKHVIFRDDDIEPYADLNALETVNQVFIDKNVPVTLAITAHPDTSKTGNELLMDTSLLNYLLSIKTNPLFEFAQHGYNHQEGGVGSPLVSGGYYPRSSVGAGESSVYWHPSADQLNGSTRLVGGQLVSNSEYSGRSYTDQYNSIKQGWDDITAALGVRPTTFIPPWNEGDENTVEAAHAVGHTLYSSRAYESAMSASVPGIELQAANFEFPWDNTTNWDTYMPDLISQTDSALNGAGNNADIVVLTHYWGFTSSGGAMDGNKIAWLETYIQHLKDRGDVEFTTLDNQNGLTESARTNITLTASNVNPVIGQSVTFTGTLSRWNTSQNKWVALANKPVQIWHVTPYPARTDDATIYTDINGNFTWTASGGWNSVGLRAHSASFYGDSSYIQSLSAPVNIKVGTLPSTTLTAASNNSTPAVNQQFTISGTLTNDTTPLAGATIQLQKNASGTWTNVAGKTNNTQLDGTYNITTSEPTAATYQYRTTYAGNATYQNTTSSVVTIKVGTLPSTTLTAASNNSTPAVNQQFTISGTLTNDTTPLAGATIQLQKNASGTWTNVAGKTNNTQLDGTYNITTSEPTAATYQYRTTYAGNATYQNTTSSVVTVTVTVGSNPTHIAISSSNSTPAVNQQFTISGTLTNDTTPLAGATIQLQKNASGTWTDVAGKTNTTRSNGTYNITTSETTAATYQYRTTYAGNATYQNTTSNVVTVTVRAGTWSSWGSLSGYLTASPATVSSANGRIDVFGQGSDHALWHRSYNNGAWSSWESLSGQLADTTGPAVSSQSAGQLDVFVIGRSDHALWHRSYANNAWSAWESLSGYLTASPAAVSSANGRIDVFGQGSDHALWHRSYANNAWSAWESLDGQLASTTGPAVSSQAAGQLDVFGQGSDHALWHRSYANNAWSSWESLSGYLTASPAAVSSANGRIDVFGQGSDHALWHRSYANNAWSAWESLGGQLLNTTGPAVSSQSAGQLDIFVIGRGDHALWHLSSA